MLNTSWETRGSSVIMRRTLNRLDKMNVKDDEHLKSRVCRFKVEALQGIGDATRRDGA